MNCIDTAKAAPVEQSAASTPPSAQSSWLPGFQIPLPLWSLRAAGDIAKHIEKGAFPGSIDSPIHGRTLIAIHVIVFARIKVTPRGISGERGAEIVHRLIEIKMIVLVEQNRHWTIRRQRARLRDHPSDPRGIANPVAVQEKEVRYL